MRKVLRIISISTGIISVVSAVVLGCIYLEDIAGQIKKLKGRFTNRFNNKNYIDEEYELNEPTV